MSRPNPPETFHVSASGCRSNRYDAARLRSFLNNLGLSEDPRRPDVSFFFGCVVTSTAEAKSRKSLRRLQKQGGRVFAAGCAGRFWNERDGNIPGIILIPERTPHEVLRSVGLFIQIPPSISSPSGSQLVSCSRIRYHLKIQEGCPGGCSYCIVSRLRPGSSSRPVEEVVNETAAALDAGFPEIVLTGVNTGLYGRDLPEPTSLPGLVERLLPLFAPGTNRLRISSLEPLEIDGYLLRLVAEHSKVLAPYIHLPLQSGDDEVLDRMERPYSAALFMEVVSRIRQTLPYAGIGLDVMTGFPGESENAFRKTLAVIHKVLPVRTHVFPFSPRPGTPAAEFGPSVPEAEKKKRATRAADAAREAARQFAAGLAGRFVEVVWEKNGGYSGEFLWCVAPSPPIPGGSLTRAKVCSALDAPEHPTVHLNVQPATPPRKGRPG